MIKVKKNHLKVSKKEFQLLRYLCHSSKNLYNSGLYATRQHFFNCGEFLNYVSTYKELMKTEVYKSLPSDPAQQTLKVVERSFRAFFGPCRRHHWKCASFGWIPQYFRASWDHSGDFKSHQLRARPIEALWDYHPWNQVRRSLWALCHRNGWPWCKPTQDMAFRVRYSGQGPRETIMALKRCGGSIGYI